MKTRKLILISLSIRNQFRHPKQVIEILKNTTVTLSITKAIGVKNFSELKSYGSKGLFKNTGIVKFHFVDVLVYVSCGRNEKTERERENSLVSRKPVNGLSAAEIV